MAFSIRVVRSNVKPAALQRGGSTARYASLSSELAYQGGHAPLDSWSMSMDAITERRGITGMPFGEIVAVHLIPWGNGEQGVLFTYANGRKMAFPIEREKGSPNG